MRVVFVLAMLALLSVVSAETIQFGNYTAIFDMKQPHIINKGEIKTFDGAVRVGEITQLDTNVFIQIDNINISGKEAIFSYFKDRSGYQAVFLHDPVIIISSMNLTST